MLRILSDSLNIATRIDMRGDGEIHQTHDMKLAEHERRKQLELRKLRSHQARYFWG